MFTVCISGSIAQRVHLVNGRHVGWKGHKKSDITLYRLCLSSTTNRVFDNLILLVVNC